MKRKSFTILMGCLVIVALILAGCASPAQTSAPAAPPPTSTASAPTSPPPPSSSTASAPTTTTQPTTSAAQQKTWTLKFAVNQPSTDPLYQWGEVPQAQAIEKATNGRVKVDIYPSDTLVKTPDVVTAVQSGTADMAFISIGNYANLFDYSDAVEMPFIPSTGKISSKIAYELYQKYPEIQSQYKDYKVLAMYAGEAYYIVGRKQFYKTLDDFKGQVFREQAGPAMDTMKALGATTTFIPITQAYMDLQKGVVDATTFPSEALIGFKIYEVAPYFTWVNLTTSVFATIMNKDVWNSFPKDIQDEINSVSGESMSINYGDAFDRCRQELPSVIKQAGTPWYQYTLPPAEVAKWEEVAGNPIWASWVKNMQAKGLTNAQQIMDTAESLSKQYNQQNSNTGS